MLADQSLGGGNGSEETKRCRFLGPTNRRFPLFPFPFHLLPSVASPTELLHILVVISSFLRSFCVIFFFLSIFFPAWSRLISRSFWFNYFHILGVFECYFYLSMTLLCLLVSSRDLHTFQFDYSNFSRVFVLLLFSFISNFSLGFSSRFVICIMYLLLYSLLLEIPVRKNKEGVVVKKKKKGRNNLTYTASAMRCPRVMVNEREACHGLSAHIRRLERRKM